MNVVKFTLYDINKKGKNKIVYIHKPIGLFYIIILNLKMATL